MKTRISLAAFAVMAILASPAYGAGPEVSRTTIKKLEVELSKRDKRALERLEKLAPDTPWCDLDFSKVNFSRRIRLFADLATVARTKGHPEQAARCLMAIFDPKHAVYGGMSEDEVGALGVTLEAAVVYEASQVLPQLIEKGWTARKFEFDEQDYPGCGSGWFGGNTQQFMQCAVNVAMRKKDEKAFDAGEFETALLRRSVELAPRASVFAKLPKAERASQPLGDARIGANTLAPRKFDSQKAADAAMRKRLVGPNQKLCATRAELSGDAGCVFFWSKSDAPLVDKQGSWQLFRTYARDFDSALGDSCFGRDLILTRSGDDGAVHLVKLGNLGSNEICGSGGWGDQYSVHVVSHDKSSSLLVIRATKSSVFKSGGSALFGDDLHGSVYDTWWTCQGAKSGFNCIEQNFWTHVSEDGKRSWLREGEAPRIKFEEGKTVLHAKPFQFTHPQYARLSGKTFDEVVAMLPVIAKEIRQQFSAD